MEETPCPLCGSGSGTPVLEAPDPLPPPGSGLVFAVVKCGCCGLIYTNPRPTEHSIACFYPTDYRPHRRPVSCGNRGMRGRFWRRLFGRPCDQRRGALPWAGPGRLLDFGCGAGSFLKTMASQGWEVTGLDAAVGAVQHVREEHRLTALVGTLPAPGATTRLVRCRHNVALARTRSLPAGNPAGSLPTARAGRKASSLRRRTSPAFPTASSADLGSAWTCRGTSRTSRPSRCGRDGANSGIPLGTGAVDAP